MKAAPMVGTLASISLVAARALAASPADIARLGQDLAVPAPRTRR